ncbi:MAG: hypothetical protein H8E72_02200 [Candidatus Marinimicrobia bacterium]|nr:hypothetical protein [Candidatus Neomarinimicrobiota bacterium]
MFKHFTRWFQIIACMFVMCVLFTFSYSQNCYTDSDCNENFRCVSTNYDCNMDYGSGHCYEVGAWGCTGDWDPVCGCDGETYSNGCYTTFVDFVGYQYIGGCTTSLEIGNECMTNDGIDGIISCIGLCVSIEFARSIIGDGACGWLINYFTCPEFGFECGDCNPYYTGTDPLGLCADYGPIEGDVTNDDIVDILDLVSMVNFIVDPFGSNSIGFSDYNFDFETNILDLMIVVNIILGND